MEAPKFSRENLAFSKSAIKMGFDAMKAMTGQAAIASEIILGATPAVPEEGKKAVGIFFREGQKGLESLKTHMERTLDLDWTAKNAPVRSLDSMETLCREFLSQADEIKKETKVLMEKASKPLPKEAKSMVDSWNESVDNSFDFLQNYMDKNFELARRALTDVSTFAASAEAKATTK